MVRVCHVTSVHNTMDDRIYVKECSSLAKLPEYDVHIVGPGENKSGNGVTIDGVGEQPGSRIKRLISYDRKVVDKALALDAALYHIHDPELLLQVGRIKRAGKKVIFDSHENYAEQIKTKEYIPTPIRIVVSGAYKFFEDRVCKHIDGAIFPCLVDGFDIFEGRVKHHCLIDNVPVEAEIPKTIEREGMSDEPYVCCAGALFRARGIAQLIDACYIAGVRLVLAGEFDNIEYEQEVKSKESWACVDYRGKLPRSEVMKLYKGATMGASTIQAVGQYYRIWNLPTKVYEFMMYELPFVISNFEYCKQIIKKYECGILVDASNPQDIARGIKEILGDKLKARAMGKAGRRAVMQEFNWGIEEGKLYKFYEDILKED